MDAADQTGYSDKHVTGFGVSLSSLAGDMVATSKLMNGKQVRGRNEGLEPVFRSEGQVSNAESTSRQPGHHYLKLLRTGRCTADVSSSGMLLTLRGLNVL